MESKISSQDFNMTFCSHRLKKCAKVKKMIKEGAELLQVDSYISTEPVETLKAIQENEYILRSLAFRASDEINRSQYSVAKKVSKTINEKPDLDPVNIIDTLIKTAKKILDAKGNC